MQERSPNSRILIVLLVAGGLLLVAAAFLLGRQRPAAAPAPLQEDTYSEITRIPLEDAKAALDAGSAVFLDVRSATAFQAGHVEGAINIPLDELETRLGELNKEQWIITYCT